jgi:hypothetical protein
MESITGLIESKHRLINTPQFWHGLHEAQRFHHLNSGENKTFSACTFPGKSTAPSISMLIFA